MNLDTMCLAVKMKQQFDYLKVVMLSIAVTYFGKNLLGKGYRGGPQPAPIATLLSPMNGGSRGLIIC